MEGLGPLSEIVLFMIRWVLLPVFYSETAVLKRSQGENGHVALPLILDFFVLKVNTVSRSKENLKRQIRAPTEHRSFPEQLHVTMGKIQSESSETE